MMPIDEKTKARVTKIAERLDQCGSRSAWASFTEIEPVIYVRFADQEPDEFIRLKVQDENGPLSC